MTLGLQLLYLAPLSQAGCPQVLRSLRGFGEHVHLWELVGAYGAAGCGVCGRMWHLAFVPLVPPLAGSRAYGES